MGLFKNREKTPRIRAKKEIHVSEERLGLRIVLFLLSAALGLGMIAYGTVSCLSEEPGWREITSSSTGVDCSSEFYFEYNLGASGASPTTEYKALRAVYTQLATEATKAFASDRHFDDVGNLYDLNHHPGEEVKVTAALYQALEKLEKLHCRLPYLSPVYEQYQALFGCTEDTVAMQYDPLLDEEVALFVEGVCAYANDPKAISLELLGDNRVRLQISDEYRDFLAQYEVVAYVDLCFLKNAFIADYLADGLIRNGYTEGILSSYDGYIRNLTATDEAYAFELSDLDGKSRIAAAQVSYTGRASMVVLSRFPIGIDDSLENMRFYRYEDGSIRHPFIRETTGTCLLMSDQVILYANGRSCADTVLPALSDCIATDANLTAFRALEAIGIHSVWTEGENVRYSGAEGTVKALTYTNGPTYQLQPIK